MHSLAVITPVYATRENGRLTYFRDTASSVLKQNLDFQWIIVNDGSPDPALADFLGEIKDERVKVLNRKRSPSDIRTASNALNYGFADALNSSATHFTYVHSDDLLTPGSLESRLEEMDGRDMTYGKMAYMNHGTLFESKVYTVGQSHEYSAFPHHTSMWSRRMINHLIGRRKNLFDPRVSYGEDLDVTISSMNLVTSSGYRLGFVNNIVYIRVENDTNITAQTSKQSVAEQIKYVYDKNGYSPKFHPLQLMVRLVRRPGFFLPENVKRVVRPLKPKISKLSMGFLFPGAQKIELDPFWFKS